MRNHSRSPLRPVTLYFGSRTTSWRVKYEKVELKEWVRVLKTALSSAPEREDTSELEPGPLGAIFAKSLGGVTVYDPCWAICLPQRRKNSTDQRAVLKAWHLEKKASVNGLGKG